MISEKPIVEITLFKHNDDSYQFLVTGLNGRVDWDLFEEFKTEMIEDGYAYHPSVKPIIEAYDHERDGAITFNAELIEVQTEAQLGTGEGEVNILPGYYTIGNCSVTLFEPLTVRGY